MISKDEMLSVADETGLTPNVVEKDYVLGWLLAAINANTALADTWIFKGGTCLKKCYFETYRFSEDLDFTLRDEMHLEEVFLKEQFSIIAGWLYEASGIEIPADRSVFDIYDNPRGHKSCEGRMYYESYFTSGKGSIPKIKLDLTTDEILVMPSVRQTIFHAYSDAIQEDMRINCYNFPEVFGEKVRALGERGRPRDLYDVINLFRNDQLPASAVVRDVLAQKCAHKKIRIPALPDMAAYKDALLGNWEPMLSHQLPSLPAFEVYWDALPEFFSWLESKVIQEKTGLATVTGSGQVYQPVYGRLGLRSLSGNSLEIIRFAAGNRLCVDLDYTDNNGRRSTRIIEPYSLRLAQNGNILLHAVRVEDGRIRTYKIDQINDASITNHVFTPRYQIELSPVGNITTTPWWTGTPKNLDVPGRSPNIFPRKYRPLKLRSLKSDNKPAYIYRCPICNKTFRRKKRNPKLNPHKSKDGWPCSGRTGYHEDTIY